MTQDDPYSNLTEIFLTQTNILTKFEKDWTKIVAYRVLMR